VRRPTRSTSEPIDDEAETILETGLGAERECGREPRKPSRDGALAPRRGRSRRQTGRRRGRRRSRRSNGSRCSGSAACQRRIPTSSTGCWLPRPSRSTFTFGREPASTSPPSPRSPRYHRSRNGGVRVTGSDRLALSAPIDTPDVPTIEIASPTRRDEARSAMAVAAALRDSGVPVRDIAVAVRDLDPYEEPLFRAAPSTDRTGVLDAAPRDPDPPVRPRRISVRGAGRGHRGPRDTAASARTPVVAAGIGWFVGLSSPRRRNGRSSLRRYTGQGSCSRTGHDRSPSGSRVIDSTDGADDRIRRFAEWIAAARRWSRSRSPRCSARWWRGYAERGLPETKVADSPALLDTETDARAIVRVRTLVRQLRHKFADRLEEDAIERSWADVADLAGVIATQRPGRRRALERPRARRFRGERHLGA